MEPSPTVPEATAAADQPGDPDANFTVSTHVLVPEEDVRRLRACRRAPGSPRATTSARPWRTCSRSTAWSHDGRAERAA